MDDYSIRKLVKENVKLGKDVQCKKEVKLVEDYISKSTMDIWCKKNVCHPKLLQYEVYKCFILEFDLAYSGFCNPDVDLFHYTFKDIVLCPSIEEVTGENIKEYFEKGQVLDKTGNTKYIHETIYRNGEWYVANID